MSMATCVAQARGAAARLGMRVALGGMERTAEEYAALFARAGLRAMRVIPTPSPYAILEAGPA